MSESEQDDRMGARLDETRKAIEASQQQLDNSQGILQANPQLVFSKYFHRCEVRRWIIEFKGLVDLLDST